MDLQARQMAEIQRKIADMESVPQTKPGGKRVDDDFRVYWKKGLLFKSDDDSTAIKLGGRIQAGCVSCWRSKSRSAIQGPRT